MNKEESYTSEIQLAQFYNKILERQMICREYLNQLQMMENSASTENIGEEMTQKETAEANFKSNLNVYYDYIRDKFDKLDKIQKPEKVEKIEKDQDQIFSVYNLTIPEAIKLYRKCNKLLEELEITSAERLNKGDQGFGVKG